MTSQELSSKAAGVMRGKEASKRVYTGSCKSSDTIKENESSKFQDLARLLWSMTGLKRTDGRSDVKVLAW